MPVDTPALIRQTCSFFLPSCLLLFSSVHSHISSQTQAANGRCQYVYEGGRTLQGNNSSATSSNQDDLYIHAWYLQSLTLSTIHLHIPTMVVWFK